MKFRTLVLVLLGAAGVLIAACSGDKTAKKNKPYHKPGVEDYDPATGEWKVASVIAKTPPQPPDTPPLPKQPKPKPKNNSLLSKITNKLPWVKKPVQPSNAVQEPSTTGTAAGTGAVSGAQGGAPPLPLPAEPEPAVVPPPPKP